MGTTKLSLIVYGAAPHAVPLSGRYSFWRRPLTPRYGKPNQLRQVRFPDPTMRRLLIVHLFTGASHQDVANISIPLVVRTLVKVVIS